MSVDDRLREGLRRNAATITPADDAVDRAIRRGRRAGRRRAIATGAGVLVAVAIAAAVAIPFLEQRQAVVPAEDTPVPVGVWRTPILDRGDAVARGIELGADPRCAGSYLPEADTVRYTLAIGERRWVLMREVDGGTRSITTTGFLDQPAPGILRFWEADTGNGWIADVAPDGGTMLLRPRGFDIAPDEEEACMVRTVVATELGAPFVADRSGDTPIPGGPDTTFGVGTAWVEGTWSTGVLTADAVRADMDPTATACVDQVLGDATTHAFELTIEDDRYTITDVADGERRIVSQGWVRFWSLEWDPTRFNVHLSGSDRPWSTWARVETADGTLAFRNVGFNARGEGTCLDVATGQAWLGAPFARVG